MNPSRNSRGPAKPGSKHPGRGVTEPRGSRNWWLPAVLIIAAGAATLWWLGSDSPAPVSEAPVADPRIAESTDLAPAPVAAGEKAPVEGTTKDPQPQFVRELLRSEVRSDYAGVELDSATLDLLAAGNVAEAARVLEARAAGGDRAANLALSTLQECSTVATDAVQQLEANEWRGVSRDLTAARRGRIELALDARRRLAEATARSCGQATFDRTAIAQRLQAAADAGDEASLRRLGEETTDPQARLKLWTSAAMLGYPPAQVDLAQHYRREFLTAQRSGGRMKFWLDVAARNSAAGKLLMAECQMNGCNGQPADAASAARLLREAAAEGDLEALDRLGSPEGEATIEERVAWAEFRDRLNEAGCYGASEYPRVSVASWRMQQQNSASSPYVQDQERTLSEQYWREHGAKARRALECE